MYEDKLNEECGIAGGFSTASDVAQIVKSMLLKLQHRGQDSAGIAFGGLSQELIKGNGLVGEVLTDEAIENLQGNFAIGHTRYSCAQDLNVENAQPFLISTFGEQVSITANGSSGAGKAILDTLVEKLQKPPSEWKFSEIGEILVENFKDSAFSILLFLPERILAFKDTQGFRPLIFCESNEGNFIASEDIAFKNLSDKNMLEINAGEGAEVTKNGYTIKSYSANFKEKKCVFEQIYFANPASNIFNACVYNARLNLGKLLAQCDDVKADIVVPVMDSGFISAVGYSFESKIPLQMGILRDEFAQRSFIAPDDFSRRKIVQDKLSVVKSVVEDKDIILVDDSIVRGTTSKEVVKMLKSAGAGKIHLRLVSAPIVNTCQNGVDISELSELIANRCKNEERIAKEIGADSVKFLPLSSLQDFFKNGWCFDCFKGNNDE